MKPDVPVDPKPADPAAPPPAAGQPNAGNKNLLDRITSDPNFINRGAAEAKEQVVAKSVVAPLVHDLPDHVEPIALDRDNQHRVPHIDLLREVPRGGRRLSRGGPVVVVLAAVLGLGAAAAAYVLLVKPAPAPPGRASPSVFATPRPTPIPTSTPTPTPTPTPSPSATPAPETVTAPAVTPTPSHPQAVTIISKSGLWLRSSPTSENRSNIIGWMPNGSTISVDSVGDFWWHGTYKGQAGYFASKYTQ